jgi:hypothetical protein
MDVIARSDSAEAISPDSGTIASLHCVPLATTLIWYHNLFGYYPPLMGIGGGFCPVYHNLNCGSAIQGYRAEQSDQRERRRGANYSRFDSQSPLNGVQSNVVESGR